MMFAPAWRSMVVILGIASLTAVAAMEHSTLRRITDGVKSNAAESCNWTKKVLIFWSVGNRPSAGKIVRDNVKQMHTSVPKSCWDVFLHHYAKGGKMEWYLSDPSWYDREVQISAEGPGFKFQLLKNHFLVRSNDWRAKYEYVWALDEDIDLSKAAIGDLFRLVNISQAAIAGPSLIQPSGQLAYQIQAPNENCMFRYTNFVEVIAPFIRMDALHALVVDCQDCIHKKTVWGLDNVWCGFVADRLALNDHSKACAILDEVPVIHRDFRTLKGKYAATGSSARQSDSFRATGSADAADVQKRYPAFFVADEEGKTLRCVHSQSNFKLHDHRDVPQAARGLDRLVSEVDF